MAKFNPNEYPDDDGGTGGSRLRTAGEFLMVIKRFTRETSNSRKEYLACIYEVIDGNHKGETFFNRLYLNEEALWVLGKHCRAMGYMDAFDTDFDRDVRNAICYRPFKARTKLTRQGEKEYVDLDFFFYPDKLEAHEREVMDQWAAEHAASRDIDDNDNGGGGFSSKGTPDDDIPFAYNECAVSMERTPKGLRWMGW